MLRRLCFILICSVFIIQIDYVIRFSSQYTERVHNEAVNVDDAAKSFEPAVVTDKQQQVTTQTTEDVVLGKKGTVLDDNQAVNVDDAAESPKPVVTDKQQVTTQTTEVVDYTAVYLEAAKSFEPVTDKVTTHTYQTMYGQFLLPYYNRIPNMKMLEIGLGCDMNYGPGASVAIYKKLFPEAELWEAEFDAKCVEKSKAEGQLDGIHTLVGDQGNNTVLDSWIETSGGNFDVVIDDGGHQNCQIWHSFEKLWPTVKPGGLYFIEDMQVAKMPSYRKANTATCDRNLIVPEKLKEFIDVLIYDIKRESDIEFIFCQSEACVLGKKK